MRKPLPSLFARLPWFPLALLLTTVVGLGGSLGCKSPTVIGTACKSDGDCNISGQVCAPGFNDGPKICTRKCLQNTGGDGCPVGYDCFPTDTTKGMTCNKVLYEVDLAGNPLLFGADCSLDNGMCGTLGSTNALPQCRKISDGQKPPMPVPNDPNAYCTGSCNTDGDCPLAFGCLEDYDGAKKCLRRINCDDCKVDANCPDGQCIPTADGTSRYCSKTCNSTNDCGGVQNTALGCQLTTNTAGLEITACVHRYGKCVGAGQVCDPCRKDADCTVPDSFCIINSGSGEGFCSKQCSKDSECTGGTVPTSCDNDDQNYSYFICHAAEGNIGQLSCYAAPP